MLTLKKVIIAFSYIGYWHQDPFFFFLNSKTLYSKHISLYQPVIICGFFSLSTTGLWIEWSIFGRMKKTGLEVNLPFTYTTDKKRQFISVTVWCRVLFLMLLEDFTFANKFFLTCSLPIWIKNSRSIHTLWNCYLREPSPRK